MSRLALSRLRRHSVIGVLLGVWTVLVFVFLFAPIVTAVVYSFNTGVLGRQSAAFTGFTTGWYPSAWANGELRHTVTISLEVAVATAVIATVLGTISGFIMGRASGRLLRTTLEVLVYLLLLVPEIVLAVALLLFYSKIGVGLSLWTLIAGHSPFTTAVVSLIVRSRVVAIDRAIEEAAADLGASPRQAFWDVTLPQVLPAVLAGTILAFTFSFDDLVISLFLATPTVTTLPVYLFSSVRLGVRPDVYAIASMMLGFTLVMLALAGLVYTRLSQRQGKRASLVGAVAGRAARSVVTRGEAQA